MSAQICSTLDSAVMQVAITHQFDAFLNAEMGESFEIFDSDGNSLGYLDVHKSRRIEGGTVITPSSADIIGDAILLGLHMCAWTGAQVEFRAERDVWLKKTLAATLIKVLGEFPHSFADGSKVVIASSNERGEIDIEEFGSILQRYRGNRRRVDAKPILSMIRELHNSSMRMAAEPSSLLIPWRGRR